MFRDELDANLIYVDATDHFLGLLAGVSDPESKRKIIGKEFITVFADEEPKRSKYAFSEPEDEKSADTKAKVILVSKDHGTFEDEDSEEAFEEFDLAEYELTPWENFEICSNCSECETVEICHRGRKRR